MQIKQAVLTCNYLLLSLTDARTFVAFCVCVLSVSKMSQDGHLLNSQRVLSLHGNDFILESIQFKIAATGKQH